MKAPAPIIVFCYKRLDTLQRTIEALQHNYLALESELFIFSDGPKKPSDEPIIKEIRDYLKTIGGFKSVSISNSEKNKGLANAIIEGVTEVINKYEKVIVLEDDLVTTPNFLSFMNEGLLYYKDNPKIFTISGASTPIKGVKENTVFFTQRADSCGWGMWKDQWNTIDWEVRDYEEFIKNRSARRKFNKMGSDMTRLLKKQRTGKINSWAIRWCYHQFKYDLLSVHPVVSKIENIGFDSAAATHTKEKFNRFKTRIDQNPSIPTDFNVPIRMEKKIIRQFLRPYTIPSRIWYKLINTIFSKFRFQ